MGSESAAGELVVIAPPDYDVEISLAYATANNFAGKPIYRAAHCFLHREAAR
ncbi:D-alanyl-D-alanine dipeptidase [compost metagenome]